MFVTLSALLILMGSSFSVVHAWGWGGLIPPGSIVTDMKRLADSIRETAQMLQTYENTFKNLQNRITLNTKIVSDFKSVFHSIEKFGNMTYGRTLINPSSSYKNTPFNKSWNNLNDALEDKIYEKQLNEELSDSNSELTSVIQQSIENEQDRMAAITEMNELSTSGSVGEKQKNNAILIINSLATADKARVTGAEVMNTITKQEADAARDRLDREKIKTGTVYGYDPYHPTPFDDKHKQSNSQNLGYLKFGE